MTSWDNVVLKLFFEIFWGIPNLNSQVWLEYAYRKHHPALQWLPTKLAEWIANNMQDELGFPDKADPRSLAEGAGNLQS